MVPFTFGGPKVETVGETSAFDETNAQPAKNKEAVAANMTKTENLAIILFDTLRWSMHYNAGVMMPVQNLSLKFFVR